VFGADIFDVARAVLGTTDRALEAQNVIHANSYY
jgi:hypothetical protein